MLFPEPEPLTYLPQDGAPYLQYTEFNRSPCHRNRLASILNLVGRCDPKPGARVIEIGCGVGSISIPIASLGYAVHGIDVHGPSIEEARRRSTFPNATFSEKPVESVELGGYDILVMTEVLEHIPDHRAMFAHICNGMKPGARFIFTVPNGRGLTELMTRPSYALKKSAAGVKVVASIKRMLHTKDLTTANEGTPHLHFFTLGKLADLFGENRLRCTAFHRYFIAWPLWEIFLSERPAPEKWAASDFARSQRAPPSICILWSFLLERT
jgi:SAM-dependent methyltransferase